MLKASLDEHVASDEVIADETATILAEKLETPLQIGQHLVRAFEAGFEIGATPIDVSVIEAILSRQLNDPQPQLSATATTSAVSFVRCEAIGNPPAPPG